MAVTAAPGTALVGRLDAHPFHSGEQRFVFPGRYGIHLIPDVYRQGEGARVGNYERRTARGVFVYGFHRQVPQRHLSGQVFIHGFGTTEEVRHVFHRHVFRKEFARHKPVFIPRTFFVAEHINDLQALFREGVKFLAEGQVFLPAGAVKQRHLIRFVAFQSALGHG